tara:strand:- start:594 stop:3218 length:2625 start_codon:yes stop_codon:yes gene_type:complete
LKTLILVFILFSAFAYGQQKRVKGFCIDKKGKAIENAFVKVNTSPVQNSYTDKNGQYEFGLNIGDSVTLVYRANDITIKKSFTISTSFNQFPDVEFPVLLQEGVTIIEERQNPFELETLPLVDAQKLTGSIEKSLVLTTAATSNNELTTNYNVRGGNYDENLVYVNGFLVYRPFLTRSGQQEGMSFIHSALVESVSFSAGGFDTQYGDKLSSVLDITYKTPKTFKASLMASLLGAEAHVEQSTGERFNYIIGARYRSNGYLLNALPTQGSYNPVFTDAQISTNLKLTDKLTWSTLLHYSSNNYRFSPETSETDFGTANEAYSFKIYFDGQEQTKFETMMGGVSLKWKPSEKTNLDLYATAFQTTEREYFDIQGQYFINELETDPSKEEYGDSIAVLGIGTFLNHARNRLDATIINIYHNGKHEFFNGFTDESRLRYRNHHMRWGLSFQMDQFNDVLSEWRMIDSAGYSIPQSNSNEVELFEVIKGDLSLTNERYTGFVQFNSSWSKNNKNVIVSRPYKEGEHGRKKKLWCTDTLQESSAKWALTFGTRGGYTSINDELYITPRAALIYYPRSYFVKNNRIYKRNVSYRLSSGMYYQPPFYREFRYFDGTLRTDVKAQKSVHVVAGTDFYFNMWQREMPFKFSGEVFYKYLWDVNPYQIENVRTRYYAENNAVAYAYGIDLNIHGEFVEGIESFFKLGLLSTKEDIVDDQYIEYYNVAGERIIFGYSEDQVVVDSAIIYPGFIPRPTDQLFNFGALVQDQMPGLESFTVQMGMQFGTRLPYGPPDPTRYKDTLRMKSYFRVDLGMSYDFLGKSKSKHAFWRKNFSQALLSFEIFNLLGINNVLSKQWIQDVSGRYYSIPNYLTQRRFNLKLILRF